MCFTICHGKRLGETLKLPRLLRVSRSRPINVSEAATSRLGLGSEGLVHIPVCKSTARQRNYATQISYLHVKFLIGLHEVHWTMSKSF